MLQALYNVLQKVYRSQHWWWIWLVIGDGLLAVTWIVVSVTL